MPISINGSGTVTGISVGGLPDGSVDADTLASNAVTSAKLASSAVTNAKLASGAITSSSLPAGTIIKVTSGTHNTTGLTTTSTSFVNYTNSNITVTKLRGPGNASGGSILLVFGNAWIEYTGSDANNRHHAYSLMRDGTELTGLTFGMGNLYSKDADGYQSNADIKYMDTANLNAGNYVYSMCIKSKDGTVGAQIGNSSRLGTWNILEIVT